MSKTLEDLGYEKEEDENVIRYRKNGIMNETIYFNKFNKRFYAIELGEYFKTITMEELKAIYQYCIDNKWI